MSHVGLNTRDLQSLVGESIFTSLSAISALHPELSHWAASELFNCPRSCIPTTIFTLLASFHPSTSSTPPVRNQHYPHTCSIFLGLTYPTLTFMLHPNTTNMRPLTIPLIRSPLNRHIACTHDSLTNVIKTVVQVSHFLF